MRNAAPIKYCFDECNAGSDAVPSTARMSLAGQTSRFTSSTTSSSDELRAGSSNLINTNACHVPRSCEEGQAPKPITTATGRRIGKFYGKLVRRVEQHRPSLGNSPVYSCNTAVWPRIARSTGLHRVHKAPKAPVRAGKLKAQPLYPVCGSQIIFW